MFKHFLLAPPKTPDPATLREYVHLCLIPDVPVDILDLLATLGADAAARGWVLVSSRPRTTGLLPIP